MNLYLLRHGEAENIACTDSERCLTEFGRDAIKNVAEQWLLHNPVIDKCIVSPYVRAQQTAKLFTSVVSPGSVFETNDILVPEVRAAYVIQFLEELNCENLLLVSHNPLLSELLALLVVGKASNNLKIVDTGELLCLSMDFIGLGMATNRYALTASSSPHQGQI